jgi:hypothetical protein
MKIIAGETWIELVPETAFEIDQLKRLTAPRLKVSCEVVPSPDNPDDRYSEMRMGAKLRLTLPNYDDWGT